MASRTIQVDDRIRDYLLSRVDEPDALRRLRDETAAHRGARMQIAPEQGQLMRLLVELVGARRALEVGTYTGYSAICIAMSLPADGRLIACDVDEDTAAIARRYFEEAGVAERIDLRIAPAVQTLEALVAAGEAGSYDFAFIDADKPSYDRYYELCLELLRPGGLIAVDNTLWGGSVADAEQDDDSTATIRALNDKIAADPRVTSSLVPIGDGLFLARKR